MPELPEVETYLRELKPDLQDRHVISAIVHWPRTIATPSVPQFQRAISGRQFRSFRRRGKYMIFDLDNGESLIVHLRMTGKFYVDKKHTPADKHTHVVLSLDNGLELRFQDPRKFGRIWLVSDAQEVLAKLGPEPLGADFTTDYLVAKLSGRKANIKALLLDQGIVAGVGNIYADEVLFAAGVNPTRRAGELSHDEVEQVRREVVTILAAAIESRGSSLGGSNLQNYMRADGEQGGFQEAHKVFRRTGVPCEVCNTPIERIVLSQRGTHFCPVCQPV